MLQKPPPKVQADSLEITYDPRGRAVKALGPIDLEVADGQFLCIVGPSGCGKSTLIRVIGDLMEPSAGTLAIRWSNPRSALHATVFQDYGIFPWMTVVRNIAFGLECRGVARRDARHKAEEWLERLGLNQFGTAYPDALSGGMRQRVAIARALAMEPELLLMDEPFAALDAQMREVLQEELLEIWERDRRTVIFVTHSLEEALILGDRVIVLSHRPGRIVADYKVEMSRPRGEDVRTSEEFVVARRHLSTLLHANSAMSDVSDGGSLEDQSDSST